MEKAEIKRKKWGRSEVNFYKKFNGKGYEKDIQKEIHSANMHIKCAHLTCVKHNSKPHLKLYYSPINIPSNANGGVYTLPSYATYKNLS